MRGVGPPACLRCSEDPWLQHFQVQVVAVADQEELRQGEQLELVALVELEELGPGQAVVALEVQMVQEQVEVQGQGSPDESVVGVGAAAVVVPGDEVFDLVTVKQYTARFHRT